MTRSVWKGPFFVNFPNLKQAIERGIPIKTKVRACTILPSHVGAKFLIHNGKNYLPLAVTAEMVGHKLGEFAPTRVRFSYRQTKNK
ncbi:mitochondrial ribosomal small subunit component [Tieghemiomyces parasiticus]|uniref:Small ribosomal subunit protein uS19m n=1 Tax=Tieghemiomyces parasiticus TaxID=78921 RepID=A0A9W8DY36_9FUNG|nr:mitochondrial ribosomal small subunit component [Tieghemiomyces parasiticus]KAJ1928867.1 mitochondrial ribosomal small subunit component [Tieghemiomyces parasiticus]